MSCDVGHSCSSDSTPSLGISMCYSLKKEKKKREVPPEPGLSPHLFTGFFSYYEIHRIFQLLFQLLWFLETVEVGAGINLLLAFSLCKLQSIPCTIARSILYIVNLTK